MHCGMVSITEQTNPIGSLVRPMCTLYDPITKTAGKFVEKEFDFSVTLLLFTGFTLGTVYISCCGTSLPR